MAVLLAVLVLASVALWLWSDLLVVLQFRQRPAARADAQDPPASILVPVCGLDADAEANWESLCRQDYPRFEVLFCVMNPLDPAVEVLTRLASRHSDRCRVLIRPEALGANHQVSNLVQLTRAARSDYLVIADSDIQVAPDYLRRVLAPLGDPAVGLVTCGYRDARPISVGGALAALGRVVDFIPQFLLGRAIDGKLRYALGPTMATRRDVLERIGGLEVLLNRIGSDFHLGQLVAEAGLRVELSEMVLTSRTGYESVREVFQREVRWARTIRMNRGPQYLGVGITFGLLYSLVLVLSRHPQWAAAIGAAGITARLAHAMIVCAALQAGPLMKWLWLLPLRDALTAAIWVASLVGNEVRWRGRRLTISPGGALTARTPATLCNAAASRAQPE